MFLGRHLTPDDHLLVSLGESLDVYAYGLGTTVSLGQGP